MADEVAIAAGWELAASLAAVLALEVMVGQSLKKRATDVGVLGHCDGLKGDGVRSRSN
jgi:hypothetical protein